MSMETSKKIVVRPIHTLFSLDRLEHTITPNGNTQLCLLNNSIVNKVSYIIKCRWPLWTASKGYIIYDIWLSSSINSEQKNQSHVHHCARSCLKPTILCDILFSTIVREGRWQQQIIHLIVRSTLLLHYPCESIIPYWSIPYCRIVIHLLLKLWHRFEM